MKASVASSINHTCCLTEGSHKSGELPMTGPKYPGVEESHKYGPVKERVPGVKDISGPVYPVDPNNKYSMVPERVSGQAIMAGPAYKNVESANQYQVVFYNSV